MTMLMQLMKVASLTILVISASIAYGQGLEIDDETPSAPIAPSINTFKEDNLEKINKEVFLKDFYTKFQKAEYKASLIPLQSLVKIPGQEATSYYWQGIVNNKMERYNDSIEAFKKADQLKAKFKDLYYEYAQALYASDILAPARKAFGKSILNKHKMSTSLYYMGFISQTLGDSKLAINYYKKINIIKDDEKKEVNQAARFQLAEIYAQEAIKSENPPKLMKQFVIPEFEYAYSLNPNSSLAPDIQKRMNELLDQHDLMTIKMVNGRPTLNPRYYLKISQEVRYDSNVILQANQVSNEAQQKAAPVVKTEVIGRYAFYPNRKIGLIPEFRGNYTKYLNSTEPAIYKNDNYTLIPALRTSYEWTMKKKMATHLIDYEYNYSARDVYSAKELVFNGRTNTYMLGEKINSFSFGETTVRYRRKNFTSYIETSNSVTNSLSFEQMVLLPKNHVLFVVGSFDMTKVENNSYDTNAYLLRLDYITPRFRDWFTPTFSLTTLLNDPVNQKATRGLEKMINPGVKLTRGHAHWRANLKYDYTRNISLDKTTYDYTKQVYGLEIEYLF
ncbi:MAG: tetratricopeptide repeat protein [Bacteriovoracaceae bacterium]